MVIIIVVTVVIEFLQTLSIVKIFPVKFHRIFANIFWHKQIPYTVFRAVSLTILKYNIFSV